ncbi:MAG: 50S ribosomal protein L31 [Candidatus Moeniiplasma glomeromycotorum]|nr:50S ribosomal protein L31 [Candidatus Moeniiplasma glomeromycotorum]MCE8167250.1 50S ribosomal protein L31 [Candidatus Moeniiplasma glomeromycotorum]MCE8168737.1 50S ribosomal protein L31 [Candidatus Moeniiplasma glomeromycotorum]
MSKPKSKSSAPVKKEPASQPQKDSRLTIHSITYNCVCGTKFETVSTSLRTFSTSSCSQCNPFYTGAPAQEVRIGAVAKFREKFEPPKKKS